MVGTAVNVTDCPEQIAPEGLAEMATEATVAAEIVMVIELEEAGEPVAQLELEVITTVTTSPFAKVVDVKVEAVSPATLDPFTCH